MGEVYRARDTRLDRTVAIKVLPASLSADPSLRQRLEREARAISSLDHPHICGLYDIGLDGGHDYLVMQYLEGSTLASRLERGALPLAEAMKIGAQIAEALAAAHRRGIVHRDLKPGNVMLTASGAKLLDFGLAKSSAIREPMDPGRTMAALTAERTILGTLHYMAPEQVEGRDADSRSDIFALGAVLYEMLSGRRPFDGDSPASVIASILSTEPRPIADVAPLAPRSLDRVIARCLAKNPDDRWQSASDLAFELRAQADVRNRDVAPLASAAPRRRTAAWLAGAAVIALAGGAAGWLLKRQPPSTPRPVVRALLPLATGDELSYHDRTDFGQPVALSPDGRVVAYVMLGSPTKLVLRTVDTGESRVLVQAAAIGEVFFSPDSQFVGFVSGAGGADRPWTPGIGGSIRKISVSGGAATTVADGIGSIKGAWWGADGFIYYSPAPGMGLWRAPAAGGQGEKLTSPDRSQGEKTHRRPFLLPGNKSLLFVVGTSRIDSFDDARIEALRLSDRSRHRLIDGGTAPLYLASGHLLYARAGKLVAVPFDPERLAVEGAPMTVLEGVADQPASGVSNHAISADGTIVYLARSSDGSRGHVAISDRQGRVKRKYEAPVGTFTGRVSPDGNRFAMDPDGATQQLTVLDFGQSGNQRLTFEWDNSTPMWMPDGSRIVFRSNRDSEVRNLYWIAADGGGTAERLTTSDHEQVPSSVAGRQLLFEESDPSTRTDIWVMSLDTRKSEPLIQTPADEVSARFSPDGRWLAYQSNKSGSWEVYVQPFPSTGRTWQVSRDGGVYPVWQRGGGELVYRRGATDVMAVSVSTSGDFRATMPVKLFSLSTTDQFLDVTPEGDFVVAQRLEPPSITSLQVIVNWIDELRAKMRVRGLVE
jgi:serine/threonine-protein kinase